MSNKRLKALLNQISSQVEKATSAQDILNAISLAKNYDGKIQFNNMASYVLICIGGLGIAGHFLDIYTQSIIMLASFACIMLGVILITRHKGLIKKVSDAIYIKNMLFENQMQELNPNADMGHKIIQTFKKEFSRGNDSNGLKALYHHPADDECNIDYYCYHYQYADKVTRSTQSGKDREEKTSFDRFGFVTTFTQAKNIQILEDRKPISKVDFKPSSNTFNQRFKIGAEDENSIKEFLSTSVANAIDETAQNFTKFNLEIADDGLACVSFKDRDVIGANRQYGLDKPQEFYNEISSRSELKKLTQLLVLKATIDRFTS